MADRTVKITLTAVTSGLVAGMKTAQKATSDTMRGLAKQAGENRAAWEGAGRTLAGFGAATAAGFAVATKAAMSWESAWTGVLKTVDGTATELERLEGDLRNMAKELPASHTEIAGVAEAAGQLGVAVGDVAAFTRTMIDLGETTNLSAEEAATSLARFTNIMGTSVDETSNLGAAVVGLGNNFATTEREIVEMSMRLAGAARQADLSEGDVLGLAAAMSSVGIEAEAGGTAMSLTMKRIAREVEAGGDGLDLFAQVAGMSAEQFSAAWGQDAAGALTTFVAGLADTESMGMSTNAVLSELGVTGIRESDALLRLSSASDVLTDALRMGNEEFEANNALILEAAQRYGTAESRMKAAGNALNDVAIDIGAMVLPYIADLADGVAGLADWFQSLPGPVKEAATGLAGVAGAASLAAGGFLLTFPRVMETVGAFRTLQKLNPRVASGLGKVGKAAGGVVAAFAAAGIAKWAVEAVRGVEDVDGSVEALLNRFLVGGDSASAYATALGDLADAGQIAEHRFGTLADAVGAVANQNWADRFFSSTIFGDLTADGIADVTERFEGMGSALTVIATSDLPRAQEEFRKLWVEAGGDAQSGADLLKIMPEYRTHLTGLATDAGIAATEANLLKMATGDLAAATSDAAEETQVHDRALDRLADSYRTGTASAEDYAEALSDLVAIQKIASGVALSERDAQRQLEAAWDDARAALKENGETLDITTAKGRDNQSALDDIAAAGWDLVEAMDASGASQEDMQAALTRTREDFVKMARRMGMTKGEAKELADQLGLFPENIDVAIAVETDTAKRNFEKFISDNDGRRIRVSVDTVQGSTFRYSPTGPVARASGGKLPGPPSSRDNMLIHAASGEWVINARSSQKHDGLLAAINADSLPAFAKGGRVGWARGQADEAKEALKTAREEAKAARAATRQAERAYGRIGSGKDNDARRKAAQRAVTEARKEQKAAETALRDAEKAFNDAKSRTSRLAEQRTDLRTDLRRGTIRDAVMGGGGLGIVDDLLGQSKNKDLSKKQRNRLADVAKESEKALTKLYKEAEKVEERLGAARDRAAELGQIAGQVSSSLQGEQSLANSIVRGATTTDQYGRQTTTKDTVTSRGLVADARARAAKIKAFAGKLNRLRQLGLSGVVLQEVAMLGSEEGGLVADAMIAGGKGEINSLNAAYKDIATFSDQAGQYVTEGFYKGGLSAAEGLVKGLEDQQAAIEKQMLKIAKGMEKALKKALGIKSPSTVLRSLMHQVGAGAELGLADSISGVEGQARRLGLAAIPGVSGSGSAPMVVGSAAASSMSGPWTVEVTLNTDKSFAGAIVRQGVQEVARTDQAILKTAVGVR